MQRRSIDDLTRLRSLRNPREKETGIAGVVRGLERDVKRLQKAVGGVGVAWEVVAPDRVREKCELVGVSRGVVTVRVRDSSARFELDRWWRSGGERELAAAAKTSIRKLKIVS